MFQKQLMTFLGSFLIAMIFNASAAFGQEKLKTEDLSEVRKNKNQIELGFGSLSNIWNGTATGTVLFKRRVNFGKLIEVNSLKLIRAYFSINTQINFTDDPTLSPGDTTHVFYHPSDQVNFAIGLGLEKQVKGKFLAHYYGIDIFTQFYKTSDDIFNGNFGGITVNQVETTDRYIQTLKIGLLPFFGAKYYFTDQVSVGIETGVQLFWFSTKFTELEFKQEFTNGQLVNVFVEHAPVKSNGIAVLFNGIRFITVGYSF